jgi:outer membrane protein
MGLQLLITVTAVAATAIATEAPPSASRVLTLSDALQTARQHQPQLWQARANAESASARADEARAPILPQLTATAGYLRTTANFVARPGSVPPQLMNGASPTSWDTYNYWTGGLTLNQFIWDFGLTTDRWRSSKANAESLTQTARAVEQQIIANVRTAYFNARAQFALIAVASENLANLDRHLKQIEGFVQAGTRPKIDLAQARTDRANGLVQLIQAQNNYAIAKAQLNQAIGDSGNTDYDVQDEKLPPVPGEDGSLHDLITDALRDRPEMLALDRLQRSQELALSSAKGAYGPSLGAAMSFTEAGVDLTNLTWNWNASVNLSWGLFQGLLTRAQVKEARANLSVVQAQRAGELNQVRVDVEQAQLQVRAAKATLDAVGEALINAKERLRLAEGRYQSGVGSVIELGDAQVAAATAAAQSIQADYAVATARAALLKALGRGL